MDGGATIDGYTGFFLGFIRNHVNGSGDDQQQCVS
jgi:hypothetical protein